MSNDHQKKWQKIKEESDLAQETAETEDKVEDEAAPSLSHVNYEELEEKLTLAEQQAHDNWEKATRAQAELENVRRRAEREVMNAHRYGGEKLLTSLIPLADSLEQALQLSQNDQQMQEGLQLTMKLLLDILEKQGVKQLDPMGETFNPLEQEAMSAQVTEDAEPNTVIAVFQKGYRLHDRLLRPARVIVSKAP